MDGIKVTIMGLGYIGLPTAALMASKGLSVCGVDVKESVVETINRGEIHIVEPDLDGLVSHVVKEKKLVASIKPTKSDVFMIAVPTPFKGNYEPDTTYVESAVRMILPLIEPGNLVILESTSPVGTTEMISKIIFEEREELKGKIHIAYCPERVLPGNVIYELEHNDRVIGGIDEKSTKEASQFYFRFVKGNFHQTNSRTAEMCKLVENSYRDVNIAFANELSMICKDADIDVMHLINLANKHPRVNILNPGPGVGGHCIAVDPWFIVNGYPDKSRLIKTTREVNIYKEEWVIEQVIDECEAFKAKAGKAPVVAAMGLSYKPDIDDLRESPALKITKKLKEKGCELVVCEPNVKKHDGFELVTPEDAVKKADIIVFLVSHKEFAKLEIKKVQVMDFCGVTALKH